MRALAITAALAAAAFLADGPLGLDVAIVGLLIVLSVAVAARRPSTDLLLFGMPAAALVAMPALRDAAWVQAIDLDRSDARRGRAVAVHKSQPQPSARHP